MIIGPPPNSRAVINILAARLLLQASLETSADNIHRCCQDSARYPI